ncbi:hypothetical protein PAEH1_05435 [Paenalcaligenes hominis]|uniref:Lipoprotein n=1 Tax=Paenalcaligenes hominis TaxID=643674 RepID=A0A1U9JZD4_9BURK|nr:hypothetical protein [Paenalcaligenes hominis]AQS51155.1 hypothetical protein PAEH1_05435 [Paenalcaligenes hominis]
MLRKLCLALSPLLFTACTTLSDMPVGTPLSELHRQFGQPSVACPPQSPQRFIWTQQPFGQLAWAADVNEQQELIRMTQVLTDREFELLTQGQWNKERVFCHFGPPAEKDYTPYVGVKMRVWSYRYKQNGVWPAFMYVYFGDDGVVKHHHPGPDPLSLREERPFFDF